MILKNVVLCIILVVWSSSVISQTLILSDNLQLNYENPALISHSEDTLIVKYEDWSFFHEVVNPEELYPRIDLTGIERLYLKSLFFVQDRERLPDWLSVLSQEQASSLGVDNSNVTRKVVGSAEVVAVFNAKNSVSHIYIFEELKIHRLVVNGDESKLLRLIRNIGER